MFSNKIESTEEFDSEGRLKYLMQIESLSIELVKMNKEILEKENKRGGCKDIMTVLKEGKVQKDMKFWHYFEDNMFLKLNRKDSVNFIEKDIDKLSKELTLLKKEVEVLKKKLIEVLVQNTHVESNISDLDENVASIIETKYKEIVNN